MDHTGAGGSRDLDLSAIPDEEKVDQETEEGDGQSEVVINTKQFSRNARLTNTDGVNASVKRSLRLGDIDKEPVDRPEAKPSDTTPDVKDTAKKTTKSSLIKTSSKGGASNSTDSTTDTSYNFTTAAQRKAALLKPNSSKCSAVYDTSVEELDWFCKQGPTHRKFKDEKKKKTEKERQSEMTGLFAERNEQIKNLSEGIEKWRVQSENQPISSTVRTEFLSPEQLWANSLIPHMMRMDPSIRDDFMVHVLSVAMKAIRGKWSGGDD